MIVDGKPTANPQKVASEIAKAWRPTFVHSQDWCGDGLVTSESCPSYPLPEIEARDLFSACKRKKGGAPGADGMSPELLSALPMEAWQSVAQWLNSVEDGEQWPDAITWTRVALLLKDPEDTPPVPGKTCLISVEAVLGRCWATVRCRQLAPWLLRCVGEGVIGGSDGGKE